MIPEINPEANAGSPKVFIPRVAVGEQLPSFRLPSIYGGEIGPADYRQKKNLVLFFFRGNKCGPCANTLRQFAARFDDFRELNAEILALDTEDLEDARQLIRDEKLPFPILADGQGSVLRQFIKESPRGELPATAIFIADRFGEIYAEYLANNEARLPSLEDILSWLQLIEVQCPECGAPEWLA